MGVSVCENGNYIISVCVPFVIVAGTVLLCGSVNGR